MRALLLFYFFITRIPVTPEYMSCFPKIVSYPNRVARMFVLRELSFQQRSRQADPRTGRRKPSRGGWVLLLSQRLSLEGWEGGATLILNPLCCDFQATTSTNWILESQNINELKSEINSLKGLLLNR